jgi:hypothetical protein
MLRAVLRQGSRVPIAGLCLRAASGGSMKYKAPLKDIEFLFNEVLDAEGHYKKLGVTDFGTRDMLDIVENCAKFCENVLLPINQSGDAEGSFVSSVVVSLCVEQPFELLWAPVRPSSMATSSPCSSWHLLLSLSRPPHAAFVYSTVSLFLRVAHSTAGCKHNPKDNSVTTPKGFKEAYAEYSAGGYSSISVPVEYGGQGLWEDPLARMIAVAGY